MRVVLARGDSDGAQECSTRAGEGGRPSAASRAQSCSSPAVSRAATGRHAEARHDFPLRPSNRVAAARQSRDARMADRPGALGGGARQRGGRRSSSRPMPLGAPRKRAATTGSPAGFREPSVRGGDRAAPRFRGDPRRHQGAPAARDRARRARRSAAPGEPSTRRPRAAPRGPRDRPSLQGRRPRRTRPRRARGHCAPPPQGGALRRRLADPERARTARLAVSGRTNRQEIAAELFVTPKTVETHLRHAYQKLDDDAGKTGLVQRFDRWQESETH